MSEKPQQEKSRLWTLVGENSRLIIIVGSIGAFLGVIGPLLDIASKVFNGDEPSPVASTGVPSTLSGPQQTTSSTVSQRELRATLLSVIVNEDLRATCFAQRDNLLKDAVLSMECVSQEVPIVRLALFDNTDAMYDAYNRTVKSAFVKRDSGFDGCVKSRPGEGEWALEDETIGRVLCYFDRSRHASIHWTYDDEKIYAYASRRDGNMKALYGYWEAF